MNRYRIKPDIDNEKDRETIRGGILLAGVSFFIGVPFCITYLLRGINAESIGVMLLLFCCIPILIIQGSMGIKMALEGTSGMMHARKWLRSATTDRVAIVDRREEFYDPGYDKDAEYIYEIAFRLNTMQADSNPDEQFIWARVSKRVFRRYAYKDTALIYYPPAWPLNFLLEGE